MLWLFMSFREPRAARGPRNLFFCIQHSSEKQVPRFARNDNFAFSANLRLRTLVAYRQVLIQSSQFGDAPPHIPIDTLRGIYLQLKIDSPFCEEAHAWTRVIP